MGNARPPHLYPHAPLLAPRTSAAWPPRPQAPWPRRCHRRSTRGLAHTTGTRTHAPRRTIDADTPAHTLDHLAGAPPWTRHWQVRALATACTRALAFLSCAGTACMRPPTGEQRCGHAAYPEVSHTHRSSEKPHTLASCLACLSSPPWSPHHRVGMLEATSPRAHRGKEPPTRAWRALDLPLFSCSRTSSSRKAAWPILVLSPGACTFPHDLCWPANQSSWRSARPCRVFICSLSESFVFFT